MQQDAPDIFQESRKLRAKAAIVLQKARAARVRAWQLIVETQHLLRFFAEQRARTAAHQHASYV